MIKNTSLRPNNYKKITEVLGENRILANELLSRYSSFRLGGPADLMYKAKSVDEILLAVNTAMKYKTPFFIIGGATNLLISDSGFRGLLIKIETSKIKLVGIRGGSQNINEKGKSGIHTVYLEVESGVGVNRLVRYTLEQGLSGLEPFLGQPGSIGGAMWINAHNMKLGKYIGDCVYSAKILGKDGFVREELNDYFRFGYDMSILQKTGEIVLSAVFKLNKGDKEKLWKFAQTVLTYRKESQPQGVYSSGCTFRNINKSEAIRLATPNYTCSAGYLIENIGLKGKKIGGAMFSPKHANFIVQNGEAKASDVLQLINLVKKKLWEKYQIRLREEIVLVGDFTQ